MHEPLLTYWLSRNPTHTDSHANKEFSDYQSCSLSIMNSGTQGLYTCKSLTKAYSHYQTTTFVLSVYIIFLAFKQTSNLLHRLKRYRSTALGHSIVL